MRATLSWKCACGRTIAVKMQPGDLIRCRGCKLRYPFPVAAFAAREKVLAAYGALYLDGWGDANSSKAFIFILEPFLKIFLENAPRELEANYSTIESLNILLEREIPKSRGRLIDSIFVRSLKQNSAAIAIGFRDEMGLMQTPVFEFRERRETESCYGSIMEQIRKEKAKLILRDSHWETTHG
jgi:hypothetical protein